MIYTPRSTVERGRPMRILRNGIEVTSCFYLDRRRRIIRRFKTDADGKVMLDETTQEVQKEEIRYGHRDDVVVEWLPRHQGWCGGGARLKACKLIAGSP